MVCGIMVILRSGAGPMGLSPPSSAAGDRAGGRAAAQRPERHRILAAGRVVFHRIAGGIVAAPGIGRGSLIGRVSSRRVSRNAFVIIGSRKATRPS